MRVAIRHVESIIAGQCSGVENEWRWATFVTVNLLVVAKVKALAIIGIGYNVLVGVCQVLAMVWGWPRHWS